ncbi:hypothetical protein PBRA_003622 [Plasmodiophora brassicae]|uniref:SKI-interacting protein SKIP SNW domain-containing protein n=1 Tax=Plasmodiophora brassicae TaxID=37360 RepID=A0A0G4II01_PLABS|nr:hypothetical protein PBRA_003622 [Plasmodiophora brassicae]
MSLADLLPAPKNRLAPPAQKSAGAPGGSVRSLQVAGKKTIPPYGNRAGYIPRTDADFDDGGAFPEIHRLQFPLGMGRRDNSGMSTALATISVSADGDVDYTGVVTQRIRKDQLVQKSLDDLRPKDPSAEELARPDAETEQAVTDKTRQALEKLIETRISAAQPRSGPVEKAVGNGPTYVRYTGAKDGETRIIRMQELPVDPIEPAKFKHMKAPAAPPSPPVPIMHSPQRKVTVEDQRMWRIPPCVSNWKNTKGYTIAADKRLAADGRGLQEVQINDNFAAFSETLYLAERNARSELAARQEMQSRIEMKKREMKEQQLRELAAEAREQRGGIDGALRHTLAESYEDANVAEEAEVEALEEREEIRHERRRELQRDLRMSHMGKNARQSKMERDANRDVSEQIALGKRAGGGGGDALFDQRLFNQSQGMSSGFGAEDSYNAYDKDLFRGNVASHVYRPSASIDEETNVQAMLDAAAASSGKFQPDRGFRGAETTVEMRASGRSKPVQFESGPMDTLLDGAVADDRIVQPQATAAPEQDPFGMDKFLTDAKRGKPLAHIGSQGFMQASGGSGPSDGYSKSISTSSSTIQDT